MLDLQRLEGLLADFPSRNIGLVGDLFLDRYLEIEPDAREFSLETGLEAYQISRIRNLPGALGTVMNNLAALGVGQLTPVTVVGEDGHAHDLLSALRRLPVNSDWIITDPHRLTPTYTKPLKRDADQQWQELHRLDIRSRSPLTSATQLKLEEHVRQVLQDSDGLIVLDQVNEDGWGVVNAGLRALLEKFAVEWPDKLMFIDSRRQLAKFGCGVLKGNQAEVLTAAGWQASDVASTEAAAAALAARTGRPVFVTLGATGILVRRPDGRSQTVPGFPSPGPIDVVGAGDSATSGIVASLLSGADEVEAAIIGNLVASITVEKLKTTGTASAQQVLERFRQVSQLQ